MKQFPDSSEPMTAEERFRKAFKRLRDGQPLVVPLGTQVTKGNVGREAGLTPEALKTARFPELAAEIAAYKALQTHAAVPPKLTSLEKKAIKRTDKQTKDDAVRQRDIAHSLLASASRRVLELTEEVQLLRQQLDERAPPPPSLR